MSIISGDFQPAPKRHWVCTCPETGERLEFCGRFVVTEAVTPLAELAGDPMRSISGLSGPTMRIHIDLDPEQKIHMTFREAKEAMVPMILDPKLGLR